MAASWNCQEEWNDLLVAGDAVGLIAVFREAASSTPASDEGALTNSIFAFLESQLFPSALDVDVPRLLSAVSMEYIETVLNATRPHTLDSRDVLIELLSVEQPMNAHVATVYLRLFRASLRQILLDTLRRKKECVTVEDKVSQTRATMRAWYKDVEERVSCVIHTFCQRDAVPKMIRTVKKFGQTEVDSEGNDDDAESDSVDLAVLVVGPDTLEALVKLSVDLVTMIGDSEMTVPLLLMVRAIAVASQPYNGGGEYLRKLGTELKRWANTLPRVKDTRKASNTDFSLTEKQTSAATIPKVYTKKTEELTQTLLGLLPSCGLCSWLLKHSDTGFQKDIMDGIAYDDNERGKDARDTKTLVSLHERKKEKDELHIFSDDDLDDEVDHDVFSLETISLRKIGALLTFYDAMTVEGYSSFYCAVISNSPTALLFLAAPMVLESLKSSSLGAVMIGLAFLSMVLPHVPAYSVYARGELSAKPTQIHEFGRNRADTGDTFGFRTKRFELMFELVKSLVNVSATSPSEDHREVARAVFTLLLQRFAADLRMLMYSSFLVVTPFASICSLMLHSLRAEWVDSRELHNDSGTEFFRTTLPRCLLQAQENWLRRLRVGEMAFVDPIIQSLNFVSFVITGDRRREPKDALFQLDSSGTKIRLRKRDDEMSGEGDCWERYLSEVLQKIVPPLRTIMSAASDVSSGPPAAGVLRGVVLSPLDCFSLSTTLSALEDQVVYTV